MQEAYFEKIRSQIIPLLRKASNEVSIAMAWFTSAELFDELIKCLKRGVRVALVLLDNPINFMEYAPDFNEFITAGGRLYIASSELGLMHHKFCVIDKAMVITGSYNWTYYAETRNVENILITDDHKVVDQFSHEFNRLKEHIVLAIESPRYTLNQLESMENVDFTYINYETQQISQIYNKPVRKIVETKTQVFVTEIKKTPKAAFNIGLLTEDNNHSESFEIFIPMDEILPFVSKEQTLYYNSKEHTILVNHVIYGETKILDPRIHTLLKEVDFDEIVSGKVCEKIILNYKMSLETNGDLRIEINCNETGKRKTITMLNQKFVKYV